MTDTATQIPAAPPLFFHIDPNTGDPRSCSKPHTCGWALYSEHYRSPAIARQVYEAMMSDFLFVKHRRVGNRHESTYSPDGW